MTKQPVIFQYLKQYDTQIAAALPRHMTVERMQRLVTTNVRRTPQLMNADPLSLFGAIIQCAQLGLEPDTGLGQAYFVPYGRKGRQSKEVQLIIGYRGMMELARRSGMIKSIEAHVVHANDQFTYSYGLSPDLVHIPSLRDERGAITHVYAIARLAEGLPQYEVMTKAEVDSIKKQSKAGTDGPWVTHYDQMACKTVIRRLFKYLPTSVELREAMDLDTRGEMGEQHLGTLIDAEYLDVSQREAREDLQIGKRETLTDQAKAQLKKAKKESKDAAPSGPTEDEIFTQLRTATTQQQLNDALAASGVISPANIDEFKKLASEKNKELKQ
jgi:recombination protein RecT